MHNFTNWELDSVKNLFLSKILIGENKQNNPFDIFNEYNTLIKRNSLFEKKEFNQSYETKKYQSQTSISTSKENNKFNSLLKLNQKEKNYEDKKSDIYQVKVNSFNNQNKIIDLKGIPNKRNFMNV